jgi:hypothetical protein
VPRKRELSNASESSIRKSQLVRYVTTTEKGPAGESVIPKAYSATGLSLLLNSGTVRLSGWVREPICVPSIIRYRSLRALCGRPFPGALENFHAGRKLLYVKRERNKTMLFLYTRGKILVKSAGSGEPSSPNCTVHLSRMTSCSWNVLLLSVWLLYADANASMTSHPLP